MHEMGIISGVVSGAMEVAREHNATSISKITLRVGEMTEAIEDALQFAFEVLAQDNALIEQCTLEVVMVSPKSHCVVCDVDYNHDRFHMVCPTCGMPGTLIQGKELDIASIDIDTEDER